MKSRALLIGLIALLSVIGIADSLYLAESAVTQTPLVCDIEGLNDCNVVAQSPYAKLFGVPLGVYGVGFYVVMLVLALLAHYAPRPQWGSALFVWAVLGALASICFVYIQLVLIQAVCVYCLISALLTFLLVPATYHLKKRFTSTPPCYHERRMVRSFIVLTLIALFPVSVYAATLRADDSLKVSDPIVGNAYLIGADVETDSPLPADLLALGTIVRVLSPVLGDALVAGGTISLNAPIGGDVRAIAGQLEVTAPISGELATLARRVKITETIHEARIAGGTVTIEKGAQGPVSIYGNNVVLGGEFSDAVHVVAGNTVTILPDTHMLGAFEYNAPQETVVPESARIDGGVRYVGSASFLPTPEEARIFAVAGFGVYLIVRIVAGMLLVGLAVGLVPRVSRRIAREVMTSRPTHLISLFALGFGVLVLTPLLLLLLAISVVGIGIMFLLGAVYLMGLLCAYVFGSLLLGAGIAKLVWKREGYEWQDAILGFLVFQVIALIPGVGFLVSLVFFSLALGAVTHAFYVYLSARERTA